MEPKYFEILDDEVVAFIEKTEHHYPADSTNTSIAEQRQFYDDLCRAFEGPWPSNVTKTDRWITSGKAAIGVRDYKTDKPSSHAHVIYIHGGGFVVGSLESHDSICAEFCAKTGLSITSVDYRLSPEHEHPTAYNDCLNTFRFVEAETDLPIILAGDSAGGTLAAAVANAVCGSGGKLIGQLLIYPALGGPEHSGSRIEHENAPMLTVADMDFYEQIRGGGRDLSLDATATPLAADEFTHLPPTVIITAACDPLAGDGKRYRDSIVASGGKAVWFNEAGLVHGYLRARHMSEQAKASFNRMIQALNMLSKESWDF